MKGAPISENLCTAHRHLEVDASCTCAERAGVEHEDPQIEGHGTVSLIKWGSWNLAIVMLRVKGT